jgi:hypothetical protein
LIKLIEIVKKYARRQGKDSAHDFDRYIDSAIAGLRELSWDVNGVTAEGVYTLDEQNCVSIPNDYIRHVLVRGIISNKSHVDLILSTSKPRKDDCGDDPFESTYEFRGTFVENRAKGRLEFGTEYNFNKVWIRYTANPEKVNGNHLVHEYLEEALLKWMHYDLYRFRSTTSAGERNIRFSEYVTAKNHARKRLKSRRREELSASIRRSRKRLKF